MPPLCPFTFPFHLVADFFFLLLFQKSLLRFLFFLHLTRMSHSFKSLSVASALRVSPPLFGWGGALTCTSYTAACLLTCFSHSRKTLTLGFGRQRGGRVHLDSFSTRLSADHTFFRWHLDSQRCPPLPPNTGSNRDVSRPVSRVRRAPPPSPRPPQPVGST